MTLAVLCRVSRGGGGGCEQRAGSLQPGDRTRVQLMNFSETTKI